MASRFKGKVGYSENVTIRPGVTEERITERTLYGDVIRNTRRLESGEKVIPDISVGNSLSVMADPYLRDNFHSIRYVEWAGARWTISEVEEQRPRLILRLGAKYNGPGPTAPPPDEIGGDSGE